MEFITKRPLLAGGVALGAVVLILFMSSGGSGDTQAVVGGNYGPSDSEVVAASQIQAAQIQSAAQLRAVEIAAMDAQAERDANMELASLLAMHESEIANKQFDLETLKIGTAENVALETMWQEGRLQANRDAITYALTTQELAANERLQSQSLNAQVKLNKPGLFSKIFG